MCTAITYKTKDFYFGRTLDYDFSYLESVTITPRKFPFEFKNGKILKNHYAIIGMAYVVEDYPLYYDAVNEKGLCMAGLNFTQSTHYSEMISNKENIAQFEFVPWVLSQCETVKKAREIIKKTNIIAKAFNKDLPAACLHWLIGDREEAITIEAVREGIKIYDNPVGVLTNEPRFDKQLFNLNNYMGLTTKETENRFSGKISLNQYSRGMGALGLPGDISSMSRFVRAAFVKLNSVSDEGETESVGQFFHILGAVEQQRGCCAVNDGYEITIYSSCCNADKGIYYYTTYNNRQITAVDMFKEDLEGGNLKSYALLTHENILFQN